MLIDNGNMPEKAGGGAGGIEINNMKEYMDMPW